MTVYNRMFRCEGEQKPPANIVNYPRKHPLGLCSQCGEWFRLYPNGKVVMHKRKSKAA